jgi:prepilin-type N-terminal cleavage/methylation domain-containing protein
MKRNGGFTLLELMVSMSILTLVMGVLMVLAMAMGRSVAMQESRAATEGEALQGMTRLTRELRQAASSSIPWDRLPTATLEYRVPTDLDGNGVPVDIGGFVELGAVMSIGPDLADLNDDGLTDTQLIWTDGSEVRVLANNLAPSEDLDGDGVLDAGEDRNGNGTLDAGILFERSLEGLQVTLRTTHTSNPRVPAVSAQLTEIVVPRNGG